VHEGEGRWKPGKDQKKWTGTCHRNLRQNCSVGQHRKQTSYSPVCRMRTTDTGWPVAFVPALNKGGRLGSLTRECIKSIMVEELAGVTEVTSVEVSKIH
jgi:hypothetical protein